MPDVGKIRVQFGTAMKCAFGCGPVSLIIEFESRARVDRFTKRLIQLQGFVDGSFRLCPNVRWEDAVACPKSIVKGETRVGRRVRWIEFDCFLKIIANFFVTRRVKILPKMTP